MGDRLNTREGGAPARWTAGVCGALQCFSRPPTSGLLPLYAPAVLLAKGTAEAEVVRTAAVRRYVASEGLQLRPPDATQRLQYHGTACNVRAMLGTTRPEAEGRCVMCGRGLQRGVPVARSGPVVRVATYSIGVLQYRCDSHRL